MRVAVIDANVVLKTFLPDPLSTSCRALLEHLEEERFELLAPHLWAYETTSSLTKAVRHGQITPEQGRRAMNKIHSLPIRLCRPDSAQSMDAFEWTLRLRRAAAYDSFYLALAESLQCNFWTTDQRLVNSVAAEHPWVRPVPEQA